MEQEEKSLLLKDLCARLPYGVKIASGGGIGTVVDSITIRPDYIEIVIKGTYAYSHFIHKDTGEWDNYDDLDRCKPYLRPMSSMTTNEKMEYAAFIYSDSITVMDMINLTDWLNSHHFDYRGLIEKNLALDCTGLHIYD